MYIYPWLLHNYLHLHACCARRFPKPSPASPSPSVLFVTTLGGSCLTGTACTGRNGPRPRVSFAPHTAAVHAGGVWCAALAHCPAPHHHHHPRHSPPPLLPAPHRPLALAPPQRALRALPPASGVYPPALRGFKLHLCGAYEPPSQPWDPSTASGPALMHVATPAMRPSLPFSLSIAHSLTSPLVLNHKQLPYQISTHMSPRPTEVEGRRTCK
jgi:hypothetical protein